MSLFEPSTHHPGSEPFSEIDSPSELALSKRPQRRFPMALRITFLSLVLFLLPVAQAHAALFCTFGMTGVRISDTGRLQVRVYSTSETPSDDFLMTMCNVDTQEGTVRTQACEAWHKEFLAALHTDRTVNIQFRDAVLVTEELGTTCTDLLHIGKFWNATVTVEAK